jgi:outer membrane PBP1 activator LpoA protein
MLGFNSCIYTNAEYPSAHLYGYRALTRYIELVGFNNPKHLKKIENWKKTYPKLAAVV